MSDPEAQIDYVNPAQYFRICQRRSERAMREAVRPTAPRKKYLHESRHKHALNRVRGHKGRFSNSEEPDSADATHESNDPEKPAPPSSSDTSDHDDSFNQRNSYERVATPAQGEASTSAPAPVLAASRIQSTVSAITSFNQHSDGDIELPLHFFEELRPGL